MSSKVADRPGAWWLATLRKRARTRRDKHQPTLPAPTFDDPVVHKAALKFYNTAFRAEQSGAGQAAELSEVVRH